jgi:hypothetical protein
VIRLLRISPLLAVLAWVAFWATPNSASADFQLILEQDYGNIKTVIGPSEAPNMISYSGTVGVFSVDLTAMTSSTGITVTRADIKSNDPGSLHQFTFALSATGFIPQETSPNFKTAVSGSMVWGLASGYVTGYADLNNQLLQDPSNPSGTSTHRIGVYGSTPYTPSFAGNSTTTLTDSSNTPFSLSIENDLTFGAGPSELVLTENTGTTLAPAPAGVVLALSGVPVLAGGYWLRRRRALA